MFRYKAVTIAFAAFVAGSCGTTSQPGSHRKGRKDPSVAVLDEMISRQNSGPRNVNDRARCLAELVRRQLCPTPSRNATRAFPIRLVLDPQYRKWPRWRQRMVQTFECVNRIYAISGVQWYLANVQFWDPGSQRHQLYALLGRLRRKIPQDGKSLVLGMTVWDEKRIYALSTGEIGLSKGGACVVPSWPQPENDCLILAHELGHLSGAKHLPGKQLVMNWSQRPFRLPGSDPMNRVVSMFQFHPRNVASIAAHRTARFTSSGLDASARCKEHIRGLDFCWGT